MSAPALIGAERAVTRRARVRVEGTVQGVGFRPHVYRLAAEYQLAGFVLNDAHGVLLEVEGSCVSVADFLARLEREAPPLAVIERVLADDCEPTGAGGFAIRVSPRGESGDAPVAPDSATCDDCLSELLDPEDRRYRYPFINCTNCGPRFTIVRRVPYDRPFTTMAAFQMCARCRAEYDDPADRRFHAQPNACPDCGPRLTLLCPDGEPKVLRPDEDALAAVVAALVAGGIVAVKGIGGFHLACRADHEAAVAVLRARKHREEKPFALMVASLAAAEALAALGPLEQRLMSGAERPIVLARRHPDSPVAGSVAPGAGELGLMLPYSPLHHLLLAGLAESGEQPAPALVMTSGNISDEPIAFRDEDATARLGALADLLLVHDRPIETRTDDSLVRVVQAPTGPRTLQLRRSRGYVPASLSLPDAAAHHILACGAELKSTFCLAKGERAWVSHHIGDLENFETLRSFTDGIVHLERLFDVNPKVLVHDQHPEYLSTKYAVERDAEYMIGVQHHHAHLAACLAEHGDPGVALGAIFDGSGYGPDGTIWGGELLVGDLRDFRRVGALIPVRLPGGARAIREPWRMACAWLSISTAAEPESPVPDIPRAFQERVDPATWRAVAELCRSGLQSPETTSMGRLFDAVGAMCGFGVRASYEGQAAIELEAACETGAGHPYPFAIDDSGGSIVIDPRETIRALCDDFVDDTAISVVASRFHATISAATVRALARAASNAGLELVVLSGGVFQNRRLLEGVMAGLHDIGLRAMTPERSPVGDGGISFGQAAVGARRMACEPARWKAFA